ncbi:MAG: DUF72 domain-containing protein [Acidobacteria bacterium]|nr:DUF72 domain-containing protein [Acidobacteriota bacterium]
MPSGIVRIGTSGWNYPSGPGTWTGVFYPPRGARPRKFDELAYYAEHFDTVEINATFYRPPTRDMAASWVRRTPPGFEFSLKLHQTFTHPRMVQQRALKALPPEDAAAEPPADTVPIVSQADLDTFRSGLDPIASAGRLGALLAQFPPSFKADDSSREYLRWLIDAFRDVPVAVELRHRSWSEDLAPTLALLNEFGAAWTQIDEPKFRFSIRQNYLPNVKGFYYLRLHGRNVEKWWRHAHADERYDYLYSADELKPFAATASAVRTLVKKMYLYLNNHFASKAVANAVVLKHQLGEPITGDYTEEFKTRYPEAAAAIEAGVRSSALPPQRAGTTG